MYVFIRYHNALDKYCASIELFDMHISNNDTCTYRPKSYHSKYQY